MEKNNSITIIIINMITKIPVILLEMFALYHILIID